METKYRSRVVSVPITGATGQILGASENRVGLIFPQQTQFAYSVNNVQPAALVNGLGVVSSLYLIGPEVRDVVMREWFVFSSLANVTITFIELLGP